MKYLQKLGKALMLPVACLPAASILMGIGYALEPNIMQGGDIDNAVAFFLVKAGAAIIDNLAWLFAIGLSFGMTKKQDGAAAMSGLIAMFMIQTLLGKDVVVVLRDGLTDVDVAAFGKVNNAFMGIIAGLVAAASYNKFSDTQLPQFLSFFSGKRCVPIVTSIFMLPIIIALLFIWPFVYGVLIEIGIFFVSFDSIGAGIYAFFNRLLIPTGLHHALNQVFWQDIAGINDIGNYFSPTADLIASDGVRGTYRVGMYMAGFFPVMMFGLPAGALAMYHTAKDNKKKIVSGLLMAAAFSSFFTGVTEPLEFAFMFLAPGLYLVHAVLTGLSVAFAAFMGWSAGFSFSAGAIDLALSSVMPMANQPYMLLVQGLVVAVIYYTLFRFIITKFNLKTPGREEDDTEGEENIVLANNDFTAIAKIIMEGLGGKDNVTEVDNCITRLRLEVKDHALVNEKKIKTAGIAGIIRPSKTSVQVIVGTQVQFVADEFKKLM